MFFDFSFFLLLAVAVLACVLGVWFFVKRARPNLATPIVIVYVRELFPLLLIVFLLRAFVLEPFRIPSGSMLPNLHAGDLILVTKYDYGIRVPVTNQVLIPVGKPKRGDVLVFYHPEKTDLHYIKRVIGLPGDQVEIDSGRVSVNGQWLQESPVSADKDETETAETLRATQHGIELAFPQVYPYIDFQVESEDEASWITMHHLPQTHLRQSVRVPPGHYFVLGDNRDRSNDSRFWGFVPDHHVAGKARFIWLHLDWNFWSRAGSIDPI